MANKNRIIITGALILLFISVSTVLAGNQSLEEILPIEIIDSDKVVFKNVRIVDKDAGIQVKGFIRPRTGQVLGIISGHVDGELLDGKGMPSEKVRASHTPSILRTKGNQRSYFTFELDFDCELEEAIQSKLKVRVSFHYTGNKKNDSCKSNN